MLGGREAIERRKRAAGGGRRLSPALLVAHVEREFPGVYWNPARWGTVDGYVPWRQFLAYAEALFPLWALDRLTLSASIGLAFAPSDGEGPRLRRQAVEEAYPMEG